MQGHGSYSSVGLVSFNQCKEKGNTHNFICISWTHKKGRKHSYSVKILLRFSEWLRYTVIQSTQCLKNCFYVRSTWSLTQLLKNMITITGLKQHTAVGRSLVFYHYRCRMNIRNLFSFSQTSDYKLLGAEFCPLILCKVLYTEIVNNDDGDDR